VDTSDGLIGLDRVPEHRRSPGPAYAAVDLGTHNCRMLVARPDRDSGFRVIRSYAKPVRLGEGLGTSTSLTQAAMDRAVAALRACARRIERLGVVRVRSIATEACRRADNVDRFIQRIRRETGLIIEPVSAADEARLTLAGCTPLLDRHCRRVLLFDIGGGSTEIAWIEPHPDRAPHILALLSLPIGVVAFAERYGGDLISPGVYAEMVTAVRERLAPFEADCGIRRHLAAGGVQMIGTSGTVTTLAATLLRLKRYDRARVDGLEIAFGDLARVSAGLAVSSWRERAGNPCIGPDRADLVIAGCAILDAVCATWPVGRLSVADRGIREGLLMSMMAEDADATRPAAAPAR
jgi:exopolyphosphatase / guanosine-5'-triphosphate,3'-diphosphate pyrophosphatase